MKIVKMALICLAVVIPVALGAFHYGRTRGAHWDPGADHEDSAHGAESREKHGVLGETHDRAHADHDHESGSQDPAVAEKVHPEADPVPLSDDQIRALGISVAELGPGNLQRVMELPGEIVLNDDAQALVTPYVSGYVTEIRKRQGDPVRKGEVMAVLNSRELADAASAYLVARERLALAEKTYEREESLWRKKISPETDYLEAKMSLASERIGVRSARQKLLALGLKKTAIDRLPGRTNASLTRYEIVSPLDGQVLEKRLSLGEMVGSRTPVYRVADMKTVWVNINLLQKQLPHLKKGMAVGIRGDDGMPEGVGRLTFIGPVMGRETRTANGRATLSNGEGMWRPGLFVTARIRTHEKPVPLLVPKEAVQEVGGKRVVFVPAQGGFRERIVTTGRSDEQSVEITWGLSKGDPYVNKGAFELKATLMTDAMDSHAGHGH